MTHVAGLSEWTPEITRVPESELLAWVVGEAEAAYDPQAGAGLAVRVPSTPRLPGRPKPPLRTPHRITATPLLERLCIREDKDILLIPIRSVLYLRQDGEQTTIEVDQQSLRVRLTLDRLENALAPLGFFRSHRAYGLFTRKD